MPAKKTVTDSPATSLVALSQAFAAVCLENRQLRDELSVLRIRLAEKTEPTRLEDLFGAFPQGPVHDRLVDPGASVAKQQAIRKLKDELAQHPDPIFAGQE